MHSFIQSQSQSTFYTTYTTPKKIIFHSDFSISNFGSFWNLLKLFGTLFSSFMLFIYLVIGSRGKFQSRNGVTEQSKNKAAKQAAKKPKQKVKKSKKQPIASSKREHLQSSQAKLNNNKQQNKNKTKQNKAKQTTNSVTCS